MIIYVLKLTDNKYYVGKTNKDISSRYNEHLNGYGASWTQKYRPIGVVEIINNVDDFDEDKYTKIYMHKYGIDNVRGGTYSTVVLKPAQIQLLEKELKSAANQCYNCGQTGHYANSCPFQNNYTKTVTCYKCGQLGHYANFCPLNTHSVKQYIRSPQINNYSNCYQCGQIGHHINSCPFNIQHATYCQIL